MKVVGSGLWVLLALVGASALPACRNSRREASNAVANDLRARDQRRVESERLYEKGRSAHLAGKATAVKYVEQAVQANPDNLYAWMLLGEIQFDEERYFEAAEAFHRASRLAPTRYEPPYNLGLVLESVGRLADAIKAYEGALALQPSQLEVMENLARAYLRAGTERERARELIGRALPLEQRREWREWLNVQLSRMAQKDGAATQGSQLSETSNDMSPERSGGL